MDCDTAAAPAVGTSDGAVKVLVAVAVVVEVLVSASDDDVVVAVSEDKFEFEFPVPDPAAPAWCSGSSLVLACGVSVGVLLLVPIAADDASTAAGLYRPMLPPLPPPGTACGPKTRAFSPIA